MDEDEQIKGVATKAGIDGMIGRLPDGYDTRVGRKFGGYDLSGGQWQRSPGARVRATGFDCDPR